MSNPIDTIWSLLFKPEEADKFKEDPEGYMAETGLDQYEPEEVHELVVMAYEKGAVDQGAQVTVAAAPAPAPPMDPTLPAGEALRQTVNHYVTESHTTTYVDDRDTNVDSSVTNQISAGDNADIDLDIDNETNTASGDGAVAAGEISDSVVNTGEVSDSILANDSDLENTVVGDDNVQINAGEGEVDLENVNFGDNGTIDNSDNSINDSFNTDNSIEDSFNDNSDNSVEDSFNDNSETTDNSDYSNEDSYNDNSDTTEDSHNSTEDTVTTQIG
jgi:hypothetical protein